MEQHALSFLREQPAELLPRESSLRHAMDDARVPETASPESRGVTGASAQDDACMIECAC